MISNQAAAIAPRRRSQAWSRPGQYFPVRHIQGLEIFEQPRGGVGVNGTTIHGTAEEIRDFASQLLLVAYRMGAQPVKRQPAARPAAA
jgi:hypothetical protein